MRKIDCVLLGALVCYGVSVLPFIPREFSNAAGTVLCFILTGVAGASAILPSRVNGVARLTAIVACSLGTGIVGGLIINILPSGLVRFNWLTYAFATTLIAYAVARVRGAGGPLEWKPGDFPSLSLSRASAVKVCASVVALGAAVVVSISSSHHGQTPFTEVWFLPDGPEHSPVGATGAVLGMKSHETSSEEFVVVVNTGLQVTTHHVTLAPNQTWTRDFSVGGEKPLATVYRGRVADPPYRTVWFVRR
ncbi:hypothetical protein A5696_03990 [Mycobacterium sp. E2699]|nr:hypothetical protein A5696_03990 [Mycobacterium sp. E2699]OBI48170.1 hypothetical protein A5705_16065 [Mycobacterium sp. E787]